MISLLFKEAPYLMKDEYTKKYYGYFVDLLDKISLICNFTYEISLFKKTENIFKTNKSNDENWNRLVYELVNKVC